MSVLDRARAPFGATAKPVIRELPPFSAIREQLMRRDRKTGRLMTPAIFDFGFGVDRQQTAISMLFAMSSTIADRSGLIMTKREIGAPRAKLQAQADSLRATAATTARLGNPWGEAFLGEENPLLAAAAEIEARIARLERETIVVERDYGKRPRRGKRRCQSLAVQGVAIRISQQCVALFGQPLPGIVAALASALLGTEVQRDSIRNWLRASAAR